MMRRAAVLTLYHRYGCHLCEQMLQRLQVLQPLHGFELRVVDVDASAQWVDRYDDKVPVLTLAEREICRYRLDESALGKALAG